LCKNLYVFWKTIWGKTLWNRKKEGNGFLRNWLVADKFVAGFCPPKERRIADKERG
jgi:hypothetical protein